MLFLRSLVFQILFWCNTILLMLIWLPGLVMPRRVSMELGRTWGRTSLWLVDKLCGLKVEWRGLENIPPGGGALIVASKHQSIWDTFVLPIRFPDFSYILKRELVWIPFFGWYLLAAEQVGINRAKGGKLLPQLIDKAKDLFAQKRQLFIFPEGTRRPAGAPPSYKFGVAQLYAATNVPVLPVALNAGLFWPRRAFLVRPGKVVIEFLPMIQPGLPTREFYEKLQTQIETASDRLIAEAVAQEPSLASVVAEGQARAIARDKRRRERA
ncbi:MAG: lysophospholipid acyltransferase family protein [Methylocystis sp.]|uniref:lysophospholipid acyltransferase family protein n=1 Tax=Methylocystis sp. TaxID=1911079 RepID=UPI003DA67443